VCTSGGEAVFEVVYAAACLCDEGSDEGYKSPGGGVPIYHFFIVDDDVTVPLSGVAA
jgi:hypothetical protein